jgi:2-polyprenyl-3-methyl-5-hydroxy-6-metoxy-1,4-benzoquinol methylase
MSNSDQLIELTDQEFWDDYWKNCPIPNTVNDEFSFERCLARELKGQITFDTRGKTILEIGCAPGKWLAFFAKELGMIPSGIDYSAQGVQATQSNFKELGLSFGKLKSADFFTLTPDRQYDIVMSLGFIEHFNDPDKVVKLHLNWLKPGGTLILGVPNFNGIYKTLQQTLSPEVLEKHNLKVMNLDYFRSLASKYAIKLVNVRYLGSFEPCLLIDMNKVPNRLQIMINVFLNIAKKIRKLKFLDHFNNKYISSYILAIYKKND